MRPLILVSNDDGVLGPGLRVLAQLAAELGEVVVVAPDGDRSATGHSITLHGHLRAREVQPGWFAVSGTPVDSVYFGCLHVCARTPDLVLSGINDGYNLGSDVYYSGTVGAAREGRLRGTSGVAISALAGSDPAAGVAYLRPVLEAVLAAHARGERHLVNINVPLLDPGRRPRIVVCRAGQRRYRDTVEERKDLLGRPYYWIGGPPADEAEPAADDLDTQVVQRGDIAVTPLEIDPTAADLETWRQRLT